MADKSASHDSGENQVHPAGPSEQPVTLSDYLQDDAPPNENSDGEVPNGEINGQASNENSNGEDVNQVEGEDGEDDGEGFDPDTLANLAALSRIGAEGDDGSGTDWRTGEDGSVAEWRTGEGMTREQVQEIVENLQAARRGEKEPEPQQDGKRDEVEASEADQRRGDLEKDRSPHDSTDGRDEKVENDREHQHDDEGEDDDDEDGEERDGQSDEDKEDGGEYRDPRYRFEDGKMKRKRNRSTLTSECPRDSIKRGIPSMCRMDTLAVPPTTHAPRKRRRLVNDVPINYELGLRVQALESLIRSGSNMEADAASSAAMETILQATRAANSGSQDAASALAQLTQNSVAGMSQDAQNGLLMDVLQQLSVASMGTSTPREMPEGSEDDVWSTVPLASLDTLSTIANAHDNDSIPDKLNLALPGFREDSGLIFVPPTVRYAEKLLRQEEILSKDALPIEGDDRFLDAGIKFAYGADSAPYTNKRISSIQAVSHTGALRLATSFLSRFPSSTTTKIMYIPDPTASEDVLALRDAGVDIRHYRFLDRKTGAVDWEGMRDDLHAAPAGSPILFHISGSTPTGAELTAPQWRLLTALLENRRLIPVISLAFQGLASGDPSRDAQPLRYMVHEGLPVVLIQSFDAMMGLYADSPAIVSVVTSSTEIRDRVDSQLRHTARAMYTHPSALGARIAHTILTDPKLYPAWLNEIKAMSDRLRSVREKIYDLLVNKLKTPGSWYHIKRASGMYCTTLLNPHLVEMLASERHIHLLPSGSFSLGCLNASKIDTLARAVDHVVREGVREAEEEAAQRVAMELALAAAKEAAAREEAEAQAVREQAEAEAALAEDTLLMERSIANAMEAQQREEEEEERTLDEQRRFDEAVRRAAERAEIARQAEAILASIQTNG
ncbi:pyridoxal phosphate-dependent transferase [Naematelia encephala]|uniref:Pyridoxal phosphate-dependent transferase n=1 Tax=Naematelia encephala TaxID=71784 RepID=A0A1Y2BL84_9TREE|nr:pyridoxal phosphate-dependent transferase [Naematelia encephala]